MNSTTTYHVSGMTCGHCVSAVSSEIGNLPLVTEVRVDLVPGGTSTVVVSADGAIADEAVAGAVAEAGYEVIGRSTP